MDALKDIIKENQLWICLDCGKCGSICPITRMETRTYTSPRTLIEKAVRASMEGVMEEPLFWSCLTCMRCSEVCPSSVHFSEFIRQARKLARDHNRFGDCTHGEMIQTWGRMMTNPDLRQNRLNWVSNDLKFSDDSDTLYFVGCLPYYDTLFKSLNVEGIEIARAAVKIMNHLGIKPQVLADERCCGHDQLWEGDTETFRALAGLNIEKLKASGAKRIVSTCPECVRTLKLDYPQVVGSHGLAVMHISELLAESGISLPEADSNSPAVRVTFQDPCRLGRHLGVFDPPRQVLTALGLELSEMAHHAESSQCCGTSCWRACGQVSKRIQVERLEEARATGAEILVTACLKCQIHLKCAQNDALLSEKIHIPIRDLTTLVAEKLTGQPQHAEPQEVPVGQR
jgi:Fe-S oxidoreductase